MLNKIVMTASFFALSIMLVACSQPEQAASDGSQTTTNSGYVSENQKFVDQSNSEVNVADADALLDDLNTDTQAKQ